MIKSEKLDEIKNNLDCFCIYYTLAELADLCNLSVTTVGVHIRKQIGKSCITR